MNKKLTILTAIILALGIIGASIGIGYYYGVFLTKHPNVHYEYYDAKVAQFIEENKSLGSVDIVFLGDSLTDGYHVKEYYSQYSVVNRGIGGDTTWGLEERLNCSAYDVNPKLIVMLIGINNVDHMLDNYERLVKQLKKNLPNTKIILLSLTPVAGYFAYLNPKIIIKNTSIKAIAKRNGCTFIDMYTPLLDNNTNELKLEYTIEGLHFTADGYNVITGVLTPVITNILGY